ncbi:MAG: ATP-binding protein [Hormoscilla sp.]
MSNCKMKKMRSLTTEPLSLNVRTFARLGALLQQQAAASFAPGYILLTEDILDPVENSTNVHIERFSLLVSEEFNALLLGELAPDENRESTNIVAPKGVWSQVVVAGSPPTPPVAIGGLRQPPFSRGVWGDPTTGRAAPERSTGFDHTPEKVFVNISFDPEAIASFIKQLADRLTSKPQVKSILARAGAILKPNAPKLQSEFTLALMKIIATDDNESPGEENYPHVCEPVAAALQQQLEQERLIDRVATQIRQSLELPVILSTAVEQVRHFLQVDRLLIYQFDQNSKELRNSSLAASKSCVTYEAKAKEQIVSVLHLREGEKCFFDTPNIEHKYRQGFIQEVEDIEIAYASFPCFLELLRRMQVRAKLIAPIVVQDQLWGLLIAQQCFEPRQWSESEKSFLGKIAEHLAIAIYQAQLYSQLQLQKENLEQRVSDRTSELHDALLSAQSANRTKSEFLAVMSHELRTPLTCVIGMSATLLRLLSLDLEKAKRVLTIEKQRSYLQTIHDNGKHLLDLINDILELSQVEAGKAVLKVREFSLNKMAYNCRQSMQQIAEEKGVKLILYIQIDRKGDRFRGDQGRIQRILGNLLSNAIKFTPSGGRVTLRVSSESNTAVFQVKDTGIGIPSEQIALLFEKFQQLDTSYDRNYQGAGLGLALTKQLVELQGGTISVESTVDIGSVFTVRLPAQPLPSASAPAGQKSATPGGRIILIENDEETAWTICDLLTAAGYQVVWLVEGTTAVKQIEILQPLVAIVAGQLPGIDGREVIRQLRSEPTTKQIKTLILRDNSIDPYPDSPPMYSGRAMSNTHRTSADDYLTKPVQPEQLLEKLNSLLVDC